jgi:glutathione S-transferase
VWRFDDRFGDDYYAARRGEEGARARFESRLAELDLDLAQRPYLSGAEYGLADIAYFPWLPRAQMYAIADPEPYPALEAWIQRLTERPAIAAEVDVVAALAR